MACRLVGKSPSSEPMMAYCRLPPWEQTSVKFESKFKIVLWRKCIWLCRLQKWRPFCLGLNVLSPCANSSYEHLHLLLRTGILDLDPWWSQPMRRFLHWMPTLGTSNQLIHQWKHFLCKMWVKRTCLYLDDMFATDCTDNCPVPFWHIMFYIEIRNLMTLHLWGPSVRPTLPSRG